MLRSFSLSSLRLLLPACALFCALALVDVACARRQRAGDVRYPPRPPTCHLQIFYADMPPVAGWDDISTFEIICYIDETETTCFSRMRAEACRMGGNIIYRLPKKVWRPREEVFGYRGMVAHTRAASVKEAKAEPDAPPPASAAEAAGPVLPLTGPASPRSIGAAAVDAGADGPEQATGNGQPATGNGQPAERKGTNLAAPPL